MLRTVLASALALSVVSSAPVSYTALGVAPSTNLVMSFNFTSVNSSANVMNVTLALNNYNVSQWTNKTANNGVYIGLGFNDTIMDWADIIRCSYVFTNSTTDKFNCTEYYYNPDSNNGLGQFFSNTT